MLSSAGCLTHMIACNLHSHEPLSGSPAALVRPILSVQQSSFEIASCFPYIKCQAFPGRILRHPPLLPVLRLRCLPFAGAGVLWYRVLRQANSQPVQPGTLFPQPVSSYYWTPVQALLPSVAVPLPLLLFSIFENMLPSEAILFSSGSGPSHYEFLDRLLCGSPSILELIKSLGTATKITLQTTLRTQRSWSLTFGFTHYWDC